MSRNLTILKLSDIRIILMVVSMIALNPSLFAEKGQIEKEEVRISLYYTNINNISRRLTASVKTKVDRSYIPVPGERINFYSGKIDKENFLGQAVTAENGEAIFLLPETPHQSLHQQNPFIYYATIEDSDRFKDNETELEIKDSHTELTLGIEDSVKMVNFFVGAPDTTGTIIPVEGVEGRVYIKRLFGLLPISDEFETTDEKGQLSVQFPDEIPGDEEGNVTIVAQVVDHEDFGNLVATKEIDWGVKLTPNLRDMNRKLWSSRANAPISLIIIVNTLIISIWGVIGFIIIQLIKLNNIGRSQAKA